MPQISGNIRRILTINIIALVASLLCFPSGVNAQQPSALENAPEEATSVVNKNPKAAAQCSPTCRGSFICVKNKCVSPCQPHCSSNQICQNGTCSAHPQSQLQTPSTPASSQVSAHDNNQETLMYLMSLKKNRNHQRQRSRAERRTVAVLVNPAAMIILPALYDVYALPFQLQLAGDYLGIDATLTILFGDLSGAAGEIGLRILPMGNALKGVYISPRAGGGNLWGFLGSTEIGYAFMPGHFALNLGVGPAWSSKLGFTLFGNLSIGLGF